MAVDLMLATDGDEVTDLLPNLSSLRARWDRRVSVLTAEIAATTAPARAGVLCAELGRIHEQHLGDSESAVRAYERALALAPDHGAALGLARICMGRAEWSAARSALERLAGLRMSDGQRRELEQLERELDRRHGRDTDSPPQGVSAGARSVAADLFFGRPERTPEDLAARATQAAAATTDRTLAAAIAVRGAHDLRLRGAHALAEGLLAHAVRTRPDDDATIDAVSRLRRDEGNWQAFADSLVVRARGKPIERAAPMLAVAAATLRMRLDRASDALRVLEAAPEVDPDPLAYCRATTATLAGRPQQAMKGLRELARRSGNGVLGAACLLSAAEAARQGRDLDTALDLYREAAAVDPAGGAGLSSGFVHRRVATILEDLGRWDELVAHLNAYPEQGEAAAFWRVRAAVVGALHGSEPSAAEGLLRSSRRQSVSGVGALVNLESLLRAQARYRELDALLEEDTSSRPEIRFWRRLWIRRAGQLDAPTEALGILDGLRQLESERAAATWLSQTLLAEQGRWAALAESLSNEPVLSGRRVAVAYRLVQARAPIDPADDIAMALGAALLPEDETRLLGRLHERLCYRSGHLAGLVDRWVAQLESRPDQPALKVRLALLCLLVVDAPVGTPSAARGAQRAAASRVALMCLNGLRDNPATWLTLRPLAMVAGLGTDSWEEILAFVLDEIDSAPPATAFWTILTASEICELRLGDPSGAIRHLERADAMRPGHPAVARLLHRLYRREGRWTELESRLLAQARSRSSDGEQVASDAAALPWLARLAMLDLDLRRDDDRALSTCRAILRDHPSFAPALRGVERLLAPRGLFGELADAYLDAAGALEAGARAVCLRAALDAAELDGSAEGPFEERATLLWRIVEDPSRDRRSVRQLTDVGASLRPSQWAQALVRCIDYATTNLDRSVWLTQVSEQCLRADDPVRAAAAAQAAVRSCPTGGLAPLLALADACAARAATDPHAVLDLADALSELAAVVRDPVNRRDALTWAAHLYHAEPDRKADAMRCTLGVLELDHKDTEALGRLIALRTERQEWRELCADLGRVVAAAPEAPDTIVLLEQLTTVLRDKLGMLEEAMEACQAILERNPRHATAVGWMARLYAARRAWPEAAQAYERHLELVSDPVVRHQTMRELAALYHDRVADPERAVAVLDELSAAEPNELDHLRRLSQIHFNEQQWASAEAATRLLAEKEAAGQSRIDAHLRLAHIREKGFGDPGGAVEHYRRAMEIDPLREATMNDLCACLQRAGDLRGVAVYRRQFTAALREGLYGQPTRIQWYRRMAENLASRGLDLACDLVTSMIDWLESHGASGRSGAFRVLDEESLHGVLRALDVPSWAITLLPEIETHLLEEHEWDPKKAGIRRTDRITEQVGNPIRERAVQVGSLLGLGRLELYLFPVTPGLVRAPIAREPTLVISPQIGELSEAVCRFTIASSVLRIRSGMRMAEAFAPEALGTLFAAITAAIDPQALPAGLPAPDGGVVRRVGRRIPKTRRTEIALALRECWASPVGLAEVCARVERALFAASVAVCGSLAAGVEALARSAPAHRRFDDVPEAVQLVRDALSEDFLSVVDRAPLA